LFSRVSGAPCADGTGDVDVITGLIHCQSQLEGPHGAVLPDDDLIRFQFDCGLKREDAGVTRPPQLFRRKAVGSAEISLPGHSVQLATWLPGFLATKINASGSLPS